MRSEGEAHPPRSYSTTHRSSDFRSDFGELLSFEQNAKLKEFHISHRYALFRSDLISQSSRMSLFSSARNSSTIFSSSNVSL